MASDADRIKALNKLVQFARQGTSVFTGAEDVRSLRRFPEFARRQLQIVDRETGILQPFELNSIQRQIFAAELRARRDRRRPWFIVLKYRRGGVTTLQQGLCFHEIWRTPHAVARSYAHRVEDTRIVFSMVSRFYDQQPERHRHAKTSAGVYHIEFPKWDSFYKAETAGATSSGRGSRLNRIHLSEAAHYPDLRTLHSGLSDTAAPDAAYVLESTANGRTGEGAAFWEFWKAARRGDSAFIPLFFPWHGDRDNRIELVEPDELFPLDDEERRVQARFGLELEQLKWWRQKRRELVADGRSASIIYQEHPNDDDSCFLAGGESYFAGHLIDQAYQRCRPPLKPSELRREYGPWQASIESGRFRIWEEAEEGQRYIIGVDPAEGVGSDDSAIVGINASTGEQAFSFNRDDIAPDVLGSDVLGDREYGLGWQWATPNSERPAMIIVERINHGHAVLTALLKQAKYPHTSVYHETDPLAKDGRPARRAGWQHKHFQLTQAVATSLREEFPMIRDTETVASVQSVTEDNGSAQFGGRDLAVAWGLCAIATASTDKPGRFMYAGGMVYDFDKMTADPWRAPT